jgi:hypothetical protein
MNAHLRSIVLTIGVLMAVLGAGAPAAAAAPGEFAVGGFRFFGQPMALAAHRTADGELNGQIKVDNSVETLTGPVTCLTVIGNHAVAGGRVENQAGDGFNVFLAVEDNDAIDGGVPDRVAVFAGPPATQEFCDLLLPIVEQFLLAVEGNVVVHDAS